MFRGTQSKGGHRQVRCLVVWVCVTAAVGLGILAVRDDLAAALTDEWAGLAFDGMLVRGTAVVAALAGAWIWLVTTITVVEAAGGWEQPTAASGPVRRLVLAACGVALVSGAVAAPASATDHADPVDVPSTSVQGRLLGGLPLPDRAGIHDSPEAPSRPTVQSPAPARAHPVARPVAADQSSVVVLAGDSLWSIAAASLPEGAGDEQVDRRWREIYAANRAVIGADPGVISPGQRLALPPA